MRELLKTSQSVFMKWMQDTMVTRYLNCFDIKGKPCTLDDALFNISANEFYTVQQLWKTTEKNAKDRLKRKLRMFSPSALLASRAKGNPIITSRTNLMQLDFDEKDIKQYDLDELKRALMSLSFIGYCGLSCSGKGVFALALISEPEKLKEYFYHCQMMFLDRGITLDRTKGGNPTDSRFVSFDPAPLFRPSLEFPEEPQPLLIPVEKLIAEPRPGDLKRAKCRSVNSNALVSKCMNDIFNAMEGNRFNTVRIAAYTIGGLGNESYLQEIFKAIESSPQFSGAEEEFKRYATGCFRNGMKKPLPRSNN